MGGFDNATWQALGLVLTLLGLGVSALLWSRRGPADGLRAVAWSLLPLAAGLTGTLRLVGDVAGAVGRWATRLVFSPTVWLGLAVTTVAVALFLVSGVLRRRGGRGAGEPAGRAPGQPRGGQPRSLPSERSAPVDEDLADIEAILRKHGIS